MTLLAAAALAGCYGSTEPATDIGETAATLNGKGTLDHAPALVNFEGQSIDGRPAELSTPQVSLPKGASGPFSQRVTHLDPATTYEFRLCAAEEGGSLACANTRTFKTAAPAGDLVTGELFGGETRPNVFIADVDASSGPSGTNPKGSLRIDPSYGSFGQSILGYVTCLRVTSKTSFTVGAVGRDGNGDLATGLLRLDGGETGYRVDAGSGPPDCASQVDTPRAAGTAGLFVYDAP
jgi:hypothetical protein